MAELFSSAAVQEALNQVVSSVLNRYEGASSAEHQLERLEMAQIKLEAALEASEKWHITDASLLRWQKKLKRAAQECDEMLHKCRQQLQEQEVRNSSSLPKRLAHSTKLFISSMFYGNSEELSRCAVQRFEWFAHGASEFLRFVEFGGTPHHHTFFQPLCRHLLAGKTIEFKSVWRNKYRLFCMRPFEIAENRNEANLTFVYIDSSMPEDNFILSLMLQISESTDVIGLSIKCMQLFTHHFESTAETVRKELTELPTQDFLSMPYVYSCQAENWENKHSIRTQLFRPNPLCCKQRSLHKSCGTSGNLDMLEILDTSLEPIFHVYLERRISMYGYDEPRAGMNRKRSSLKESPLLRLGLTFMPHGSSEDLESSVIEVINGEEQLHTNITLEQFGKIMLPKAIDCLRLNAEGKMYQMLWKSKHSNAYLQAVKESSQLTMKRRAIRAAMNGMMLQQHHQQLQVRVDELFAFLSLWAAHAPVRMQCSIRDWIQKEKEYVERAKWTSLL